MYLIRECLNGRLIAIHKTCAWGNIEHSRTNKMANATNSGINVCLECPQTMNKCTGGAYFSTECQRRCVVITSVPGLLCRRNNLCLHHRHCVVLVTSSVAFVPYNNVRLVFRYAIETPRLRRTGRDQENLSLSDMSPREQTRRDQENLSLSDMSPREQTGRDQENLSLSDMPPREQTGRDQENLSLSDMSPREQTGRDQENLSLSDMPPREQT